MTPSALPLRRRIPHLPVSFLFKKRLLGLRRTFLFYYSGAMGWQAAKGSSLSDSFFSNEDIIPFSRGIEKTLKRPSGRDRNYPSFWRHLLYGLLLAHIGLRLYSASYYRLPILWWETTLCLSTQKNSSTLWTPRDTLHLGTPEFLVL